MFKFVIFLMLCSCIGYFLVLNSSGSFNGKHMTINNSTVSFIHVISRSSVTGENASPVILIFPHSYSKEKALHENDERAVESLREFLQSTDEFDGATCLQNPSTHNSNESEELNYDQVNTARNISLESSWCRFMQRSWSVNIRNTGPVQKVIVQRRRFVNTTFLAENSSEEASIMVQKCNIVQGPFVIRKDVFQRIGGLLDGFGKVTLLEFFLRSKGTLKMAKLTNCAWNSEITRVDRGTLEGSNDFSEYVTMGNKHKILRIVTKRRIEWTACVANWKLCPEKPYEKPRDLFRIALPICCSVVLGQMLEDLKRALGNMGIEYRLLFGTLLGAVRSQAIIPWTFDIDLAISEPAFNDSATFSALQKELGALGNQYFVGESFGMPRAHILVAPYIEVDTSPFFDGPDDLEGTNGLFSEEIEESVKGMLPIPYSWRYHGYVDFYPGLMSNFSLVTINNQQYTATKDVDEALTHWYGKDYRQPILKGKWSGLSTKGYAS